MTGARILLRSYPAGVPAPENFELVPAPVPEPGDGEVLLAVTHLSIDPFPRLRMRTDSRVGPPLPLGTTVDGRGIGRVLASRAAGLAVGDHVMGDVGWQSHVALPAAGLRKLDLALGPPQRHLSLLGPSGLTAYFAMVVLGGPKPDETVLIAPAAGSVGTVAIQLAKAAGARVVGVGSGPAQLSELATLGVDVAVDHRDRAGLATACPTGVDVFLDGVGGALHDAVAGLLNPRARIVLLGFIAGYNDEGPPRYGDVPALLFKRARIEGFLLADWQAGFDKAMAALAAMERAGTVRAVETVWHGLARAPEAFCGLFGDAPAGKQIVTLEGGT